MVEVHLVDRGAEGVDFGFESFDLFSLRCVGELERLVFADEGVNLVKHLFRDFVVFHRYTSKVKNCLRHTMRPCSRRRAS